MQDVHAIPTVDEVREQVRRIQSSLTFARSNQQQSLLGHMVEKALADCPDSDLSDNGLAADFFYVARPARLATFDCHQNSICRVTYRKMVQSVRNFYKHEADTGRVLILFPNRRAQFFYADQVTPNAAE